MEMLRVPVDRSPRGARLDELEGQSVWRCRGLVYKSSSASPLSYNLLACETDTASKVRGGQFLCISCDTIER